MTRVLLLSSTLVCLGLFACTASRDDAIEIDGGRVIGVTLPDSPVTVYRGIPYAAPPAGDLRWKSPQPLVPWEGVRQADTFSDGCIQVLQRSRLPWSEEFMHLGEMSEDCLYLNVWTAAEEPENLRPVMFYIHGGGLREGSGSIDVYDGEELVKKGVVLVTINYRLGPLGFLSHPELTQESEYSQSGNYGFQDQVAALKWVQSNIQAFGGDPGNVTVFGQSAGARSTSVLVLSPLARGLFHRAIIHSGAQRREPVSLSRPKTLAEAEAAGLASEDTLDVEGLAGLRQVAGAQFVEPNVLSPGAIVDGWVVPTESQNQKEVPLIVGVVADDGYVNPGDELTSTEYENEARERYGDFADAYLALYPAEAGSDPVAVKLEANRDKARVSVSLWAEKQGLKSDPVFTYYFDRAIPWPEHPEFGSFHTGEIPYVFNNLKKLDRPWEQADHTIADQTSSYWVNFATSGDPNGDSLTRWTPFSSGSSVTMGLGDALGEMPLASPEKVAFWTAFFDASVD